MTCKKGQTNLKKCLIFMVQQTIEKNVFLYIYINWFNNSIVVDINKPYKLMFLGYIILPLHVKSLICIA